MGWSEVLESLQVGLQFSLGMVINEKQENLSIS